MLFTLVNFHVFHPIISAHLTYVFLSLIDDMHIVGFVLDVVSFFFTIIHRVFSTKIFHSINEVFSLVFIRIRWAKANYTIHFCTSQNKNPIPFIMAMFPNSN